MCESHNGGIMVCDRGNRRIQEFFLDGRPARVVALFTDGTSPNCITSYGTAEYLVTDLGRHRVLLLDGTGAVRWAAGTAGEGDRQFQYPRGIAVLPSGHIVVADSPNKRLHLLSNDGEFVRTLYPSGAISLKNPDGVAVGGDGLIYVVDRDNGCVMVVNTAGDIVRTLGTPGAGNGQLNNPYGVAVDSAGNVLVCDKDNSRVVVFHVDGSTSVIATREGPTALVARPAGCVVSCLGDDSLCCYWM